MGGVEVCDERGGGVWWEGWRHVLGGWWHIVHIWLTPTTVELHSSSFTTPLSGCVATRTSATLTRASVASTEDSSLLSSSDRLSNTMPTQSPPAQGEGGGGGS